MSVDEVQARTRAGVLEVRCTCGALFVSVDGRSAITLWRDHTATACPLEVTP